MAPSPSASFGRRLSAALSSPGFWLRGALGYLTAVPVAVAASASLAVTADTGGVPPAGTVLQAVVTATPFVYLLAALPAVAVRLLAAALDLFGIVHAAVWGATVALLAFVTALAVGGGGPGMAGPGLMAIIAAAGALGGLVWRGVERLMQS